MGVAGGPRPYTCVGELHLEVYMRLACTHCTCCAVIMSEEDRQEIRNQMEEYEERKVNCYDLSV